jgi:hypothetical protein
MPPPTVKKPQAPLGYDDTDSLKEKDISGSNAQSYSDDPNAEGSKYTHLVEAMSRMQ